MIERLGGGWDKRREVDSRETNSNNIMGCIPSSEEAPEVWMMSCDGIERLIQEKGADYKPVRRKSYNTGGNLLRYLKGKSKKIKQKHSNTQTNERKR